MNKIFSGDDRAKELGFRSYRDWVIVAAKRQGFTFNSELCDQSITAYVNHGRWAADCECGDTYYVSPSDPVGFCYGGCGNAEQDGKSRPVIFPANREEVEAALLEREYTGTVTGFNRLGTQAVLHPNLYAPKVLPRNWSGEKVEHIRKHHENVKKEKEQQANGESMEEEIQPITAKKTRKVRKSG